MTLGPEGPPALYLVATPIGNLGDLTERARHVLAGTEFLYAEDTRHSRRLLRHLEVEKKLRSCHEHNEESLLPEILGHLRSGKSCALLSDAGTPGISDPGFRLVRACRREGLPVVPLPGPNAAIAALSASGLPTDRFHFFGFLPPKSAARRRCLEEHAAAPDTLVFYESPHRIGKFLNEVEEVLGPERCVCLARELTKRHETILTGPINEVRETFARRSGKGEFVLLVAKNGYEL